MVQEKVLQQCWADLLRNFVKKNLVIFIRKNASVKFVPNLINWKIIYIYLTYIKKSPADSFAILELQNLSYELFF